MNKHTPIQPDEFFDLYQNFKPHVSRLGSRDAKDVITFLIENTEEEVSVTEIRTALRKSQGAVSGVLWHLRALGLVNVTRQGTFRFYTINAAQMQAFLLLMASVQQT